MLGEPSTLASAIGLVAETLEADYQIDPAPLFREAGLSLPEGSVAGARYPVRKVRRLWSLIASATKDPAFGLKAGRRIRPASFHAVGFSWLASSSLREALERVCRYYRLITTASVNLVMRSAGDRTILEIEELDPADMSPDVAVDAFFAATLELCRFVAGPDFRPVGIELIRRELPHRAEYESLFGAPVIVGAPRNALVFDTLLLESPLRIDNPEVLRVTDGVAENYIAALNPNQMTSSVRRMLMKLLPAGHADQAGVARRLNMSASTLQRQLRMEGTSYRDVLDGTRRGLAEAYLREGRLSHAQVAYLLGFSDQSSFSRAYRRWTGFTPRTYRSGVAPRSGDG